MDAANVVIRDESAGDVDTIAELIVAAFASLEISRHTEHFVVAALRDANALTLSLVAELDGRIVGHIAFSPVRLSDGTAGWYGLGPVAVLPSHQRRGIGAALIEEGLSRLRARGARGCCLVGHPTYYGRFGFTHVQGLVHPGVPADAFFALAFDGLLPHGEVTFHAAFGAAAPSDGR